MELALKMNIKYREGYEEPLYRTHLYYARPAATQKISTAKAQCRAARVKGKNVLLVDDSIVRGTTCHEIIQMARDAARKVFAR